MSHTISNKKNITSRINRIVGQLEAVKGKLDKDEDCYMVLQLLTAARGALSTLTKTVIEDHLEHHIVTEDSEDKRVDEMEKFKKLLKSYLK